MNRDRLHGFLRFLTLAVGAGAILYGLPGLFYGLVYRIDGQPDFLACLNRDLWVGVPLALGALLMAASMKRTATSWLLTAGVALGVALGVWAAVALGLRAMHCHQVELRGGPQTLERWLADQ